MTSGRIADRSPRTLPRWACTRGLRLGASPAARSRTSRRSRTSPPPGLASRLPPLDRPRSLHAAHPRMCRRRGRVRPSPALVRATRAGDGRIGADGFVPVGTTVESDRPSGYGQPDKPGPTGESGPPNLSRVVGTYRRTIDRGTRRLREPCSCARESFDGHLRAEAPAPTRQIRRQSHRLRPRGLAAGEPSSSARLRRVDASPGASAALRAARVAYPCASRRERPAGRDGGTIAPAGGPCRVSGAYPAVAILGVIAEVVSGRFATRKTVPLHVRGLTGCPRRCVRAPQDGRSPATSTAGRRRGGAVATPHTLRGVRGHRH